MKLLLVPNVCHERGSCGRVEVVLPSALGRVASTVLVCPLLVEWIGETMYVVEQRGIE